ncbi:MAG: BolA family transcriptional regulator [Rhodobacteraceae bacterium]|nr:BolA family transcriptional regulator [Paracoccaceae bacterium]
MRMVDQIEEKLVAAFAPEAIKVIDDSASHAGHAGAPAGGESHFHVVLKSTHFAGKSRIARHRAVHAALGPDIISKIHALSLELSD